jgi:hypothetical protein
MLKFINKKGQKVLEVKDNGDLTFVAEELKKTGLLEDVQVEKEEEQEDK